MEAPNIQLYDFLRYDFHLTDIKSLEFMHILDKEYKSGLRDDFTALDKKFDDMKHEFRELRSDLKVDLSELRSDLKVELGGIRSDLQTGLSGLRSDLRVEIKDSKVGTIRWSIALFVVLAGMILAAWLKK